MKSGRFVTSLLAALLATLGMLGATITPARAADLTTTVTLTAVTTDATGVTIEGTVTNTGDPLYKAQVVLWRDRAAMTTRDQLTAALATDPNQDTGDRITEDGAVAIISSGRQAFDSEQAAPFSVHATWDTLGITDNGVYFFGVHVRGASVSWGSLTTIERERTLVTRADGIHVDTARLVAFTSTPSLIHDSVFVDDHLADELTGRLADLLAVAGQPNASWAIDPLLYSEVSKMAEGYEVLTDGILAPGTGQDAAKTWLTAFDALPTATGHRMLWSDPDLALGLASGDAGLLDTFIAADALDTKFASLPLVIRAANGLGDESFVKYVSALGPSLILAEATDSGTSGDSTVLATLPAAYPPGPDDDTSDVQVAQRAQAEDFLANTARVRVLTTSEDAHMAGLPASPFARVVPLSSMTPTGTLDPATLAGPAGAKLTSASLDTVRAITDSGRVYSSLTRDDKGTRDLVAPLTTASLSQQWPADDALIPYAQAGAQWLRALAGSVTLTATAEVKLTSRQTAFPVTINNGLGVPVYVVVGADSSSTLNMTIPETSVIMVSAGDKVLATLTPKVSRDGDVTVIVYLQTEDGVRIGDTKTIRVTASQSAWMGWIVVVAAAALFVVGTFMRLRTAKKKSAAADPHDPTPTPVDLTPTPDDSTPVPADRTPTPDDPTPTPVDPFPAPVDLTPTPPDPSPVAVDPSHTPINPPINTATAPIPDPLPAPPDPIPTPPEPTPASPEPTVGPNN